MMKKRSFSKRFLSLLSALTLLFAAITAVSPTSVLAATVEEQIAALEKEQEQLKGQIADAENDMADSKKTRDLYTSQINNVTNQIELLDSQINALDSQTAAKNAAIADLEKQIKANEAEKAKTQEMLGERLRAIAKRGNHSTIQLLMNTENYVDYLIKEKMMETVAEKDQAAIDALEQKLLEIQAAEEKVKAEKQEIENKKKEIEALRASSNSKKQELDNLYTKANAIYQSDKNEVAALNKELEQTEANIKKLLAAHNSTGSYVQTSMFWPVPTIRRISSNFGYRWGRLHKGMDIANGAAYGHSIVAAADGTVIYSNTSNSWGGGYGYYCMVDHGKDAQGRQIVTLYAHMSRNNSYVGQKVTGGQTVLGKIGSTGNSYGAHLHFEVRVNGSPVDPLKGYVSLNGK